MILLSTLKLMKRTNERILKAVENHFGPKSVRVKTLRKLLVLHNLIFVTTKNDIMPSDLKENPTKCIDYFMKVLKIGKRTAYDYYTTLLYLTYFLPAILEFAQQKIIEDFKVKNLE